MLLVSDCIQNKVSFEGKRGAAADRLKMCIHDLKFINSVKFLVVVEFDVHE